MNGVTSLYIENNILWVGAYSGLYSTPINKGGSEVSFTKHLTGINPPVRSMWASNDGSLWIGTLGEGLLRYYPASEEIITYRKSDRTGSISDDYIASVYEGKDGVLWVGTSSSGLNKFNLFSEKFRTLIFPESFPKPEVSSILEDRNGNLSIGTSSGEIIRVKDHLSSKPGFKMFWLGGGSSLLYASC